MNLKDLKFVFKVKVPTLHFVGHYTLNMQFLFLNIYGEGLIKGNFSKFASKHRSKTNYFVFILADYVFTESLKGKKIQNGGEEYMQFEQAKIKISYGELRLHLDNLFKDNDKALADAANTLINENSEFLFDAIKPSLQNAIALQSTNMANKITNSFPYKELFPK